MTAYCRPKKYPIESDMDAVYDDAALEIWCLAYDRCGTEIRRQIAQRLRELFPPSVSPVQTAAPPGSGVSPTSHTAPGGNS